MARENEKDWLSTSAGLLLLTVLALTAGVFFVRTIAAPEGAWSAPSGGIQAMLYCPNIVQLRGRPMRLHVKMRNVTTAPLALPAESDFFVHIKNDGKDFADDINHARLAAGPTMLLPGQVREFHLVSYRKRGVAPGLYEFSGQIGPLGGRVIELPPVLARVW